MQIDYMDEDTAQALAEEERRRQRPDIDYTDVFGNTYDNSASTEKPIKIMGVGDRMAINTGNGYIDEFSRKLPKEEVSIIRKNLNNPAPDEGYFGIKKPTEEDLYVNDETNKYEKHIINTVFEGNDPRDIRGNTLLYGKGPAMKMMDEFNNFMRVGIAGIRQEALKIKETNLEKGMISENTIDMYAQHVAKTGEFPKEFGRLFRLPAAQTEVINRVNEKLSQMGINGAARAVEGARFAALKKSVLTANSPTFRRLVNNAEILAVGVKDPYTGKMRESEFDQIIKLRNDIDDKLFSKINSDLQAFNRWDQWLSYKTSDPKMARLLSKVMAATDTLGSIYAGGGTVTSDFKMKFARDMFETALSKEAFKEKILTHKESVLDRAYKFSEVNPVTLAPTQPQMGNEPATSQPAGKQVVERRRTKDGRILVKYSDGTLGAE